MSTVRPAEYHLGQSARYQVWGQARCPIYRSGTLNVQHSTLNFQRGDRKGACWTEYGDRHNVYSYGVRGMGTDTILDRRVWLRHTDIGTDTMSDIPIRNVQRPTFNSQLSTGSPKGRMLGRIWGQTQCVFVRGTRYGGRRDLGPASLAAAHRYGDRHGVRYTDQERSTSNIQLSTFNGVTERAHGGRDMGTDTQFGRLDH